jgi:hypothetical protein
MSSPFLCILPALCFVTCTCTYHTAVFNCSPHKMLYKNSSCHCSTNNNNNKISRNLSICLYFMCVFVYLSIKGLYKLTKCTHNKEKRRQILNKWVCFEALYIWWQKMAFDWLCINNLNHSPFIHLIFPVSTQLIDVLYSLFYLLSSGFYVS